MKSQEDVEKGVLDIRLGGSWRWVDRRQICIGGKIFIGGEEKKFVLNLAGHCSGKGQGPMPVELSLVGVKTDSLK